MHIDFGSGTRDTLLGLKAECGECHAFEPSAAMFERLKAKEYSKCGTIKFHHEAAWVTDGSVDFYEDNRGLRSSVQKIPEMTLNAHKPKSLALTLLLF